MRVVHFSYVNYVYFGLVQFLYFINFSANNVHFWDVVHAMHLEDGDSNLLHSDFGQVVHP